MLTRRAFLAHSTTVASMAVLLPTAGLAERALFRNRAGSLGDVSCAAFGQAVNTRFIVSSAGQDVTVLELVEVAVQQTHATLRHLPDGVNEKFALRLQGQPGVRLLQDTYRFTHPVLGEFDMFIVPLFSLDATINEYEAIFNRPVRPWVRAN
jgi:hypothetical protein